MSIDTSPAHSVTVEELRDKLTELEKYHPRLTKMGQSSSGVELAVESDNGYVFFTVTDLSDSMIVRRGRVSITIAANTLGTATSVTLSPALTGATTDYLIFATVNTTANLQLVASARLSDLSTLVVLMVYASAGHTHSVDVLNTTSLTESAAGDPHTHDVDPDAVTSAGQTFATVAQTQNVAWMIIRA